MKIDEKSVIPLGWALTGFGIILSGAVSGAVAGAMWVSTVDFRLERIEEKLSIPSFQSNLTIMHKAVASSLRKDSKNDDVE